MKGADQPEAEAPCHRALKLHPQFSSRRPKTSPNTPVFTQQSTSLKKQSMFSPTQARSIFLEDSLPPEG